MTDSFSTSSPSDAELVIASRSGNRDAFGQIVRKYQSMVSGLIYAACGDLHRSEDIAQETFISAWKSLSGLHDGAKLAGWLSRIARHRISDHFREPVTPKVQLNEELAESLPQEVTDETMTADEKELLWKTLSRIPQPYRETMVLYYRQGQSTAEVAAAMETTDAGVRQRLTRGRQMLREELALMLERNLSRSAPGPNFSMAVMAALPLASVPGATITATATAKTSAAAKGGSALLVFIGWLGFAIGLGTLGLITVDSIRRAKSSKARRSLVRYWAVFWAVLVVWVAACVKIARLGHRQHWDFRRFTNVYSVAGMLFGIILFGLLAWSSSRQLQSPGENQSSVTFKPLWRRFLCIAPMIFWGISWLIQLALRMHDQVTAEATTVVVLAGCFVCALRSSSLALARNPLKMAFETWVMMVMVILAVINLRLRSWMMTSSGMTLADAYRQIPLWSINLCGAVLLGWMTLLNLRQVYSNRLKFSARI